MKNLFVFADIVVCALLLGTIVLQAKGTGLGNSAVFGGSGENYSSKRGVEKIVFRGTIVLAVIFALLSLGLLVL